MNVADDLTGVRYGRLVGIRRCGSDSRGRAIWLWHCDCGNEKAIQAYVVKNGSSKSCGCLLKEANRNLKHGGYGTRLYRTWCSMRERCNSKTLFAYRWYGAIGISICEEWDDFAKFREWANSSGYDDTMTIERIDGSGNYCPENCKWIPLKEQGRNKKNVVHFTINGVTKPLIEWAEQYGVRPRLAYQRYKRGKYPFRKNEMNRSILHKCRLKKL
jgi:hypothetical protein